MGKGEGRDKAGPPEPTPYSGRKYQAPQWAAFVDATEYAIYEVILRSERRLTNDHVHNAFVELINHLRSKAPAALGEDAPAVAAGAAPPVLTVAR